MDKKLVMLFLIVVLLTACAKEFEPDVSLKLSADDVTIESGSVTKEFITAKIKRTDDNSNDTIFTLNFGNKNTIYATDIDGNKIGQLNTRSLRGKDAEDTLQFKIFAKKGEDDVSAIKQLQVSLYWEDNLISTKMITVEVK